MAGEGAGEVEDHHRAAPDLQVRRAVEEALADLGACDTHIRAGFFTASIIGYLLDTAKELGKPPAEDAWLGKATERIFLPDRKSTRLNSSH